MHITIYATDLLSLYSTTSSQRIYLPIDPHNVFFSRFIQKLRAVIDGLLLCCQNKNKRSDSPITRSYADQYAHPMMRLYRR